LHEDLKKRKRDEMEETEGEEEDRPTKRRKVAPVQARIFAHPDTGVLRFTYPPGQISPSDPLQSNGTHIELLRKELLWKRIKDKDVRTDIRRLKYTIRYAPYLKDWDLRLSEEFHEYLKNFYIEYEDEKPFSLYGAAQGTVEKVFGGIEYFLMNHPIPVKVDPKRDYVDPNQSPGLHGTALYLSSGLEYLGQVGLEYFKKEAYYMLEISKLDLMIGMAKVAGYSILPVRLTWEELPNNIVKVGLQYMGLINIPYLYITFAGDGWIARAASAAASGFKSGVGYAASGVKYAAKSTVTGLKVAGQGVHVLGTGAKAAVGWVGDMLGSESANDALPPPENVIELEGYIVEEFQRMAKRGDSSEKVIRYLKREGVSETIIQKLHEVLVAPKVLISKEIKDAFNGLLKSMKPGRQNQILEDNALKSFFKRYNLSEFTQSEFQEAFDSSRKLAEEKTLGLIQRIVDKPTPEQFEDMVKKRNELAIRQEELAQKRGDYVNNHIMETAAYKPTETTRSDLVNRLIDWAVFFTKPASYALTLVGGAVVSFVWHSPGYLYEASYKILHAINQAATFALLELPAKYIPTYVLRGDYIIPLSTEMAISFGMTLGIHMGLTYGLGPIGLVPLIEQSGLAWFYGYFWTLLDSIVIRRFFIGLLNRALVSRIPNEWWKAKLATQLIVTIPLATVLYSWGSSKVWAHWEYEVPLGNNMLTETIMNVELDTTQGVKTSYRKFAELSKENQLLVLDGWSFLGKQYLHYTIWREVHVDPLVPFFKITGLLLYTFRNSLFRPVFSLLGFLFKLLWKLVRGGTVHVIKGIGRMTTGASDMAEDIKTLNGGFLPQSSLETLTEGMGPGEMEDMRLQVERNMANAPKNDEEVMDHILTELAPQPIIIPPPPPPMPPSPEIESCLFAFRNSVTYL